MIRKAIITAAGMGTRLLPMSKELPKEMLPIFLRSKNGLILKPLLQALFEQLYSLGITQYCFVIGRGKRAIEDHFTPDYGFLDRLAEKGRPGHLEDLTSFYHMVENSTIIWVNQPEPKGFGDAVLKAQSFVSNEDFMVAAADTYIASENGEYFKQLIKAHLTNKADASFLVMEVPDPGNYGVVEASGEGEWLRVLSAEEKPARPKSNLAILPFYIFKPKIFPILATLKPGAGGEIQLTDAISTLTRSGGKVYASKLKDDRLRLDIGTPERYWEAVRFSHQLSTRQ